MEDEEDGEHEKEEQDEAMDNEQDNKGSDNEESGEDDDENNSCIIIYFQSSDQSAETRTILRLLEQDLDEDFFDQLRTKKQLGYYVSASTRNFRGVLGYRFLI